MTLTERFYEMTADVREQAGAYAARAADVARDGADRAAAQVHAVKTPVQTLTQASYAFNDLAHAYVKDVVEFQSRLVADGVEQAARRLRLLSEADSIDTAWRAQVAAFDGAREQLATRANTALGIALGAGRGVSELALKTYAELVRDARGTTRPVRATSKSTRRAPTRKRKARRKAA